MECACDHVRVPCAHPMGMLSLFFYLFPTGLAWVVYILALSKPIFSHCLRTAPHSPMYSDGRRIGSNCPQIRRTVLNFWNLSFVLQRLATALLFVKFFSIELNDKTDKSCIILVRVFYSCVGHMHTRFLDMPIVNVGTAYNLFDALKLSLSNHALDFSKCLAFMSDTTNVMKDTRLGVSCV